MKRRLEVALVGSHLQENLACGYLAACAEAVGHKTHFVPFNGRAQIDAACERISALAPDLVGVSVPYQTAIAPALELAASLRAAGYAGHLTCGGHIPTLCYEELLCDCSAFDTAVRHEGERTLVEMLERIAENEAVRGLPGLVWREEGRVIAGPPRGPLEDLDALPSPRRHEVPFTSSGVAVAFVAGSRGCIGTCAYCSIRAFAKDMGGPSLRMRSPRSVAEEIAALFHERGASVFYFVDDLFFLPSEEKTVERILAIREELKRLNAPRLVFCAKARPETMTAAALEAAKALGVVHVFLGIENASPERLRYLGRVHTPEENVRALALCRAVGVRTSFNLMAFDPESTLEDVAMNVEFASLFADQPWSFGRTEIHSGTRLLERLREEGRLEGDYRSYGYRMRDDRAEAMFRILRIAFRDRTLAMGSLHNTMTNLSFTRQVHEAFFPGKIAADLSARVDALMTEVHGDSVMRLRRIIDFCGTMGPADSERIRAFAVREALEANAAAVPWVDRAKKLLGRMNTRGTALRGR